MVRLWIVTSALAASVACVPTPNLTFEDASADASGSEEASTGPADAGARDATDPLDGAPIVDAGRFDCSNGPPPGTNTCCAGKTPCVGVKCVNRCGECVVCTGRVCCAPASNAQPISCVDAPTACPNGGGSATRAAED